MSTNGSLPREPDLQQRVIDLEHKLDTMIWLHAELAYALRLAAAMQYAQAMGPQVQQAMVDQIMTGVV